MADDPNQPQNSDQNVPERPLDPSENAQDLMGDQTGRMGATKGSAPQTSAEPSDHTPVQDDPSFGGALGNTGQQTNPSGIPQGQQNDQVYDKQTLQGQSDVTQARNNDLASEDEKQTSSASVPPAPVKPDENPGTQSGPSTQPLGNYNSQYQPVDNPGLQGEESASGTAPDTEQITEKDTLERAQEAGLAQGEDEEHPQELNLGGDIDKAEQEHQTS